MRAATYSDAKSRSSFVNLDDVFCYESPGGTHICLVMTAYGQSLADWYRGRLSVQISKRILGDVLYGLADIHRAGVVHAGTSQR